ncbi:MAG: MlaD family protein [candidate division Zixibacteria bacterium]|nr:MlaD family protein [candidate division Zixibacteria bacterium]
MKRSIRVPFANLKVGLLLTFALAMALWASLGGGGTSIFEGKNEYITYFRNVAGLLKGSPVWMSGVEVGNVKSITFVNLDSLRQIEVRFRVSGQVMNMMTEGTQVQLGTIGFLGDKYVEVVPGLPGGKVIPEGSYVPPRDVGEASAMFKEGQSAIQDVRSLTTGLDTMLQRMNRGEGTLGKLSTDSALYINMTKLLANLTILASDLQKNQERIVGSIEKTSTSVSALADKMTQNEGTMSKLMTDPALYNNLAATSAQLDSITTKLNEARGSLGLMVNDTAMYTQMVDLLARVNGLVADIQSNPRKYFKFSVF